MIVLSLIAAICIPNLAVQESSTFPPMGEVYHPVSTSDPEAQKYFNKGLANVYAYNHDLGFVSFEKASEIDPNLAMAYWGMALALGQNINTDVTPENEKKAYVYAQKALSLISNASLPEQAYIKALVTRYTDNPSANLVALRFVYRDAMKKVMNSYPEDLDAATLYSECILNLDPWRYWTLDGRPQEGTLEAIEVLKSVLIRNPEHLGANHFYIHAWEESQTPQEALLSAFRLTTLFPEGGHLLHMPCHIFLPCGYYDEAIKTNTKAIAADWKYIEEYGMEGEYSLHYTTHNYKVLIRAYNLAEDYENAMRACNELIQFNEPYFEKIASLPCSLISPMEVKLYFHRWEEIVQMPLPQFAEPKAYLHFAKALAYIKLGDREAYENERKEVIKKNPTEIDKMKEFLLDAAFSKFQHKPNLYIDNLKKAVEIQDRLEYGEPPLWYTLIRGELGEALLAQNRFTEAETVFRKALRELQRNGRLLNGLAKSLKGQNRNWDAWWTEREAASNGGSN